MFKQPSDNNSISPEAQPTSSNTTTFSFFEIRTPNKDKTFETRKRVKITEKDDHSSDSDGCSTEYDEEDFTGIEDVMAAMKLNQGETENTSDNSFLPLPTRSEEKSEKEKVQEEESANPFSKGP